MSAEVLTCQRILSIIVFLGFMIHHMLRVNISIAIVDMVVKNNSNDTYESQSLRFNWNEEEKNNILGCFFWGYLTTQVPGGRLSEKFGSRIVVGTGLLTASILTILTPIASYVGYYWLTITRICLGIALGIHWPSTPPIATNWIPPAGRSTFMSHMTASSLGAALTLPTCGYLIFYGGWPSVFYVTGSISLVWTISWFYFVYDQPDQHPRISKKEKEYLKRKLKTEEPDEELPIPWIKILTSVPVWAFIVGNTCASCTFFIAFNQLPSYMSQVLHFNIRENGWFSSLPYLVRYLASISSSLLADKIIESETLSTTSTRKIFTVTLFAGTACLFTAQAVWGYNSIISIVVFTSSLGLMGLATPGFYANPLDIAPPYSGTIFGISQIPVALVGYFTTKVVGLFTKEEQTFEQWTYVFWMLVAVNLFAAIICGVFVSGERQRWSLKYQEREMKKLKNTDNNEEN